MKKCPYCGREYPDDVTECLSDQHELVPCFQVENTIQAPTIAVAAPPSDPAKTLFLHVILPGVGWLILFVVVTATLTPLGTMILNCAFGVWAARDCSKIQQHGTRVLGMAFKPIIAFYIAAIGLCGLGFIWHLILRYWVINAPLPETIPASATLPPPLPRS